MPNEPVGGIKSNADLIQRNRLATQRAVDNTARSRAAREAQTPDLTPLYEAVVEAALSLSAVALNTDDAPLPDEVADALGVLDSALNHLANAKKPPFDWDRKGMWVVVGASGLPWGRVHNTPAAARDDFLTGLPDPWEECEAKGFRVVELVVKPQEG